LGCAAPSAPGILDLTRGGRRWRRRPGYWDLHRCAWVDSEPTPTSPPSRRRRPSRSPRHRGRHGPRAAARHGRAAGGRDS
jgi:hypothetical protein